VKPSVLLAFVAVLAVGQDTVTVDGVVVNKVTGAGIADAVVWLWRTGTTSSRAVTNEAGAFYITGLTPGDYNASVHKSGYSNPEQDELVLPGDRPRHHLSSGPDPVRLRFELNPPAVLRGRVVDADGNPARAALELGRGLTANTDADGGFVFDSLWPGPYTLLARPILKDAKRVSGKDEIRSEPVPTFYPSVQDRSLAEIITVRAGAELSGYEIRLQSAEVHRVRGVVLNPDGTPCAKATVALQARVSYSGGITFTMAGSGGLLLSMRNGPAAGQSDEKPVVTAEDGVFEFPSVRAGEWTIRVTSDWVRDEIRQRNIIRVGSAEFKVEHKDPDELKIPFATPFNLSLPAVVVLSDGSAPAPGLSVAVTLISETTSTVARAETFANGVLQFGDVFPGTHQIRADVLAGNYYVDSILLGSTDVTGQSVDLTPASPPIRIVLKPAGVVRGTIEDADSGAVVLFPQSFAGAGYLVQSAVRTFEITGIAPGEYYAIALDHFDIATIADAQRLRGLMPRATGVRVEPGSTASLQLRVNHVPD
jgi:hypothetical protein